MPSHIFMDTEGQWWVFRSDDRRKPGTPLGPFFHKGYAVLSAAIARDRHAPLPEGPTPTPHQLELKGKTPGCNCGFCTDAKRRPIMCQVKWDALPVSARLEIGESLDD